MKSPILGVVLALGLVLAMSANVSADVSMANRIAKATEIVDEFKQIPEKSIPPDVLKNSKGLAIISMLKAGLVVGARTGSGIVIVKNATTGTWSAPSAIDVLGGSVGLQIGAEAVDLILVLNTDAAVEAFSKNNFSLGAGASIAAGPVGRTAEAAVAPKADFYTYSRSKGGFLGISLEGMALKENKKVNEAFYGSALPASDILSGKTLQPAQPEPAIDALYKTLTNL